MATIFIVTEGIYSGYHIVGVFSSREKAAEFCPAAAATIDYARIEEYELDTLDNNEYLQETFAVDMDLTSGDLIDWGFKDRPRPEMHPRNYSEVTVAPGLPGHYGPFIMSRSVVSAEHAVRLAAEHRQSLLRQNA